ncbi:MAG: hypothetical protein AABM66_08215 [Actinomycetota bacterium]
MSALSRRKGARGELEVVELLRAAGFTSARRNFGSGSAGGGDIAGGPGGIHLEIKRGRRIDLPGAVRQAELEAQPHETPVVAHRRDGEDWNATLPLDDLLALLALREREA